MLIPEEKLLENKELVSKFKSYKSRAERKQMVFNLTLPEFDFMTRNRCFSCLKEYDGKNLLGIDRLDNNEGYTLRNSRTCCWECNRAKNDMSMLEYAEFLGRFSPEKAEHVKHLKECLDLSRESGIELFPLARLNDANIKSFSLKVDDFKPILSGVLPIKGREVTYYRKMFCIFNNYYEYLDMNDNEESSLPKTLLAKLRKDYKNFIKGNLKKGQNFDDFYSPEYEKYHHPDVIINRMKSRLMNALGKNVQWTHY